MGIYFGRIPKANASVVFSEVFRYFMVNQQKGSADNLSLDTKIMNGAVSTYKSAFQNIASKTYLKGLIDFLKAV